MVRSCDAFHDNRFCTSKPSIRGTQRYNLRGSAGDMTLLKPDSKRDDLRSQDDRGSEDSRNGDMVRIPGGTFRMGSDRHYPEEAPAHRVVVDGFWIDRTPVTNRQFKRFMNATGHRTLAEIRPIPNITRCLAAHDLRRLAVFVPPSPDGLHDWSRWSQFRKGADWRNPMGRKATSIRRKPSRRSRVSRMRSPTPVGRQGPADRSGVGIRRSRRTRRREFAWGDDFTPAASIWPTPGRASFPGKTGSTTATSEPRRSGHFRRTDTASST